MILILLSLQVESAKKRLNESATKTTPVPAKKAKLATPEKTGNFFWPFIYFIWYGNILAYKHSLQLLPLL